ncbi:hypothetical protein E8E11_000222 [Didymella keratinophila]|nr:hypothetical protein E8E11_000222 [Didymella keratinophila]
MPIQFWRSPGNGSQDTDPLLEAAIPTSIDDDLSNIPQDDGDSDSDGESDDEDHDIKDARAQRLRETEGWYGYLKDFSIFLPYVIPRRDIKVQFCLLVCILALGLERVLTIAIPYALGVVADKVTHGSIPMCELLIFLALDILNSGSGVSFIQDLAKIPIKQFSYRELTNHAFSHVMRQSIGFHSTQDSAEVMKAVEQGEALGNVLESVVIDIAPTFIDVTVACVMFYRKFNPTIAIVLAGASILYLIAEASSTRLTTGDRRNLTKAERVETQKMHQAIQGWQTVTYFNQFKREARTLSNAVADHMKAKARFEARRL